MSAPAFTLRRMTAADKPAVLAIASRTWGGTDYLPAVFDDWVRDEMGEFTAVLAGDQVVGCAKLTFLTPTDAWLEGLRKDPRLDDRGLGRVVVEHLLDVLSARDDLTSVRFSTYVKNLPSRITNERAGFRLRNAFSIKGWEGSPSALRDRMESRPAPHTDGRAPSPAGSAPAPLRDESLILSFLQRHPYFETGTAGLMVEGWKAWPWSTGLFLQRFARRGACRGVLGANGLEALGAWTMLRRPGRTGVRLVCLESETDEAAAVLMESVWADLAAAAGEAADQAGTTLEVEWMVPPGERYRRWAAAGGLATLEQEDDFLVYELPLETLALRAGREARP